MKKILFSFIIILGAMILRPFDVFATSGACSYHSGVNCSAGYSVAGNVICNDGWVNSSVLFSNADECHIDSCPQIVYGLNCTSESDYSRIQQEVANTIGSNTAINARRGLLGSDFGNASADNVNSAGQARLDSCRQNINLYNQMVSSRQQCEEDRQIKLSQEIAKEAQLNLETSKQVQIDIIFNKYFDLAMQDLPEYKDIVDPDVIKKISLNPVNKDKTFNQIIIETYSKDLPINNTDNSIEKEEPIDPNATNRFSDIFKSNTVSTNKPIKELKSSNQEIGKFPATETTISQSTSIPIIETATPPEIKVKTTFLQKVFSIIKHLKFW